VSVDGVRRFSASRGRVGVRRRITLLAAAAVVAALALYGSVSTAAARATCTINGRPASCARVLHDVLPVLLFVVIPLFILLVVCAVFWVISLVHVLGHQDVPDRVLWIVLHFVLLGPLAGPIYYVAVQRPYERRRASMLRPPTPWPSPFG